MVFLDLYVFLLNHMYTFIYFDNVCNIRIIVTIAFEKAMYCLYDFSKIL